MGKMKFLVCTIIAFWFCDYWGESGSDWGVYACLNGARSTEEKTKKKNFYTRLRGNTHGIEQTDCGEWGGVYTEQLRSSEGGSERDYLLFMFFKLV